MHGSPLRILLLAVLVAACGDAANEHPQGIGNACEKNDDCPTQNCYLGPGGGYCTATCFKEGSTAQCPEDTVCKPIQGGAARCLLVCGSSRYCPPGTTCDQAWCPPSSSCVSVSETDLQACEPSPN